MKNSVLVYPRTKNSLEQVAKGIFMPVKKRLCVTCYFISGAGKRTLLKFLLNEKNILKSLFGNDINKTIFVWVDPDDILGDSSQAYLQLMLDILYQQSSKLIKLPTFNQTSNPLLNLKTILEKLIVSNYHIVFLLNDFEYTLTLSANLYRNLEGIISLNKKQITFVFLSSKNFLDSSVINKFHNLKYAISRSSYYQPLLELEDIYYIIKELERQLNTNFSLEYRNKIIQFCGGHPQLLKYAIHIFSMSNKNHEMNIVDFYKILSSHHQLNDVCTDIWNFLNPNEKDLLLQIVKTQKLPAERNVNTDFLVNTRLIQEVKPDIYNLFGQLFKDFVERQLPQDKLTFDVTINQIYMGLKSISDRFTLQEFKLLKFFIENQGKVVSREQVADVLWEKDSYDKYSDWSIDKVVSTLRKKLEKLGYSTEKLVTLKKRGFTLSQKIPIV